MTLKKETHNSIKFMRISHKVFKLLLNIDFYIIITKKIILLKSQRHKSLESKRINLINFSIAPIIFFKKVMNYLNHEIGRFKMPIFYFFNHYALLTSDAELLVFYDVHDELLFNCYT